MVLKENKKFLVKFNFRAEIIINTQCSRLNKRKLNYLDKKKIEWDVIQCNGNKRSRANRLTDCLAFKLSCRARTQERSSRMHFIPTCLVYLINVLLTRFTQRKWITGLIQWFPDCNWTRAKIWFLKFDLFPLPSSWSKITS